MRSGPRLLQAMKHSRQRMGWRWIVEVWGTHWQRPWHWKLLSSCILIQMAWIRWLLQWPQLQQQLSLLQPLWHSQLRPLPQSLMPGQEPARAQLPLLLQAALQLRRLTRSSRRPRPRCKHSSSKPHRLSRRLHQALQQAWHQVQVPMVMSQAAICRGQTRL